MQITKVAASAERPANVALYIDVHDSDGKAVPGLNEKNFRILEDGKLVAPSKAKRALLDTSSLAANYTMLLVDLSGPVVDSEDLPELAASVGRFVDRVGAVSEVAVGAFDGSDEVAPFLGFGATAETSAVVDGIRHFRPHNRNTNLNGAVYQGLHALGEKLAESKASEKSATLVVYTDRGDLSHTVSAETLKQGMNDSPARIFIIGAGEKINRPELTAIGRTSALLSTDPKAFKKSFDEVIQKLSVSTNGRYVLSYCSPKRRGDHKVEIQVVTPHDKGSASYRFNADGFSSGCSPKRKPSFNLGGEGEAQEAAKDAKPGKPPKPAKQPKDDDQEDSES